MSWTARPRQGSTEIFESPLVVVSLGIVLGAAGTHRAAFPLVVILALIIATGIAWRLGATARASGIVDRHRLAPHIDRKLSGVGQHLFMLGTFSLGFLSLRVGPFTLSDLCFLGAMAAVVAQPNIARPRFGKGILFGSWLYLAAALLTTVLSSPSIAALLVVVRLAYLTLLWLWLGVQYIRTWRHAYSLACAWCLGAALNGAVALLDSVSLLEVPWSFEAFGRYGGLTEHPNDLGGSAAIVFPVSLALARSAGTRVFGAAGKVIRLLWIMIGVSLILSGSVSATTAAFTGGLVFAILDRAGARSMSWHPGRGILVALGLLTVILLIIPAAGSDTSAIGRGLSLVQGEESLAVGSTVENRSAQYGVVLSSVRSNPVIGSGLDLTSRRLTTGANQMQFEVHNFFLRVLYEVGIVGLVGMALIVGSLFRHAVWLLRTVDKSPYGGLAPGLVGAMCSGLVLGLAQPLLFQRYYWMPAVFVAALWSMSASDVDRGPLAGREG